MTYLLIKFAKNLVIVVIFVLLDGQLKKFDKTKSTRICPWCLGEACTVGCDKQGLKAWILLVLEISWFVCFLNYHILRYLTLIPTFDSFSLPKKACKQLFWHRSLSLSVGCWRSSNLITAMLMASNFFKGHRELESHWQCDIFSPTYMQRNCLTMY